MLKKLVIFAGLALISNQILANFGDWKKLTNAQTNKPLIAGLAASQAQFKAAPITIKCSDGDLSLINNPENRLRSRNLIEKSHLKNLYAHSTKDQQALKNGQFDFSVLSKKQVLLALKYADPGVDAEKNIANLDAQTLYELSSVVDYLQTDIIQQEKIGTLFAQKILKKINSTDKSGEELIGDLKNLEFQPKFEKGVRDRLAQEKIQYQIEKLESVPVIKGIDKRLTVKLSPQANYLMTSEPHSYDLNVYNINTGEKKKFGGNFGATCKTGAFSYDEKYLAVPTDSNIITIYEVQGSDYKPLHTLKWDTVGGNFKLLFSKTNQLLIHGNNVKIFDLKTQSEIEIPLAYPLSTYSFGFTDNGQYLSVASFYGDSFICDLKKGNYAKDLRGKGVSVIRLDPQGKRYIVGFTKKPKEIRNFATDQLINDFSENTVKFDADGHLVLSKFVNAKLINDNVILSDNNGDLIFSDRYHGLHRKKIYIGSHGSRTTLSKDKSTIAYQSHETGDICLIKLSDRIPQELKMHEKLQIVRNEKLKPGIGGNATLAYLLEQKNKQQNVNKNNGKEEEK
ncbi:MAG: hypothetical protein BWY54_00830 [Candidatus Dependentiae bacterium ADurb.Bin331]|nr:MAG: hypothetical protein BWY54_00830 [Candidatus Dependentiae bacterium ADurb.Bin331]